MTFPMKEYIFKKNLSLVSLMEGTGDTWGHFFYEI